MQTNLRCILIIPLIVLAVSSLCAQEPPRPKFGKVTAADFAIKSYSLDSNANAMIIADIGSTQIVGNDKNSFSLEFKNYRRARIFNKNAFDLGTVSIYIYANGDAEEEVKTLKAVTYNLENGKVIESKLDVKSHVFKDRLDKHRVVKKFTFPNLREGSIIEYEYVLKSDFIFNLQPWTFQGSYPCLWSEYTVGMPEFLYYVSLVQGYLPYSIKDQKDHIANFTIEEEREILGSLTGNKNRISFDTGVTDFRWVIRNVPAFNEESYTSSARNHVSRIEFQLAELREPVFVNKKYMGTWEQTCKDLLAKDDFGKAYLENNEWMSDVVAGITLGITNPLMKGRAIFAYVRDNITCNGITGIYTEKPLKTVWKSRNGSLAEVNLLLTGLLSSAGLSVDPVILSTRSHGWPYDNYPLIDKFNYVIARVNYNAEHYYLDASELKLGFGKLPFECYNGHARVINEDATAVDLSPDLLREASVSSVLMINDGKGGFAGNMDYSPGYFESLKLRNKITDKGLSATVNDLAKESTTELTVNDPIVDSLNVLEEPLTLHYKFEAKFIDDDVIYFNPMLSEAWKDNPFKNANRLYPVEMPYTFDQTYLLRMDVPNGYVVDELPKQTIVKLNEQEEGLFEYRLSESNGAISLRSRLRIKKTSFTPNEYDMLREFFALVVKKHSEVIVFKKKK